MLHYWRVSGCRSRKLRFGTFILIAQVASRRVRILGRGPSGVVSGFSVVWAEVR